MICVLLLLLLFCDVCCCVLLCVVVVLCCVLCVVCVVCVVVLCGMFCFVTTDPRYKMIQNIKSKLFRLVLFCIMLYVELSVCK